jgi:hypothetical protein
MRSRSGDGLAAISQMAINQGMEASRTTVVTH